MTTPSQPQSFLEGEGNFCSARNCRSDADQIAVILQARTGSSRYPGKVLADLAGRPMLAFLVERLKRCSLLIVSFWQRLTPRKMMLLHCLVRIWA